MSMIFDRLRAHALELEKALSARAFSTPTENTTDWYTKNYVSAYIRRANLDIIETDKLYMMHLCVFPKTYDTAPLYGFDIVAGQNKVTGAFLDVSPLGDSEHPLCKHFEQTVQDLEWSKPRELPDWAKRIFGPRMIAAGNINSEFELIEILNLSKNLLINYLDNIAKYRPVGTYEDLVSKYDFTDKQNFYCQQQKCNPHTPRVLKSLGFSEEMVHDYINKELFPELV